MIDDSTFSNNLELKKLVTFVPNKKEPIHNWYHFKEGFSKELVEILLSKFELNNNCIVLDPFSGSGTTVLTCKQNGYRSVGFDVSPFFVFVSRVKTADYDLEKLKTEIAKVKDWKFEKPKKLPKERHITKVFPKYTLERLIFYKNKISQIKDDEIRDFLMLALIDSSMKSSWAVKDGAVVKIDKRGKAPLRKMFKYKIKRMVRDIERNKPENIQTRVEIGDARNVDLEDESIDAVITSPPYLNQIKYTKIYSIETSLFSDFPKTEMKSFLGERVQENIPDVGIEKNLPTIAYYYFDDMNRVLKELYRVCKNDAKIAIVIGGGCFPDRVVESDRITSELAEKIGFNVDEIVVARQSWCTRKRTIKVGKIRESVILLTK